MSISAADGSTTSVEHEVRVVVAEKLGLQEEAIAGDASIVDDLGADSLDTVEMVIALEGKFGIAIPDEDAAQIGTVRQAVDYISRAIESRH
jgi:acyl carrier protein